MFIKISLYHWIYFFITMRNGTSFISIEWMILNFWIHIIFIFYWLFHFHWINIFSIHRLWNGSLEPCLPVFCRIHCFFVFTHSLSLGSYHVQLCQIATTVEFIANKLKIYEKIIIISPFPNTVIYLSRPNFLVIFLIRQPMGSKHMLT